MSSSLLSSLTLSSYQLKQSGIQSMKKDEFLFHFQNLISSSNGLIKFIKQYDSHLSQGLSVDDILSDDSLSASSNSSAKEMLLSLIQSMDDLMNPMYSKGNDEKHHSFTSAGKLSLGLFSEFIDPEDVDAVNKIVNTVADIVENLINLNKRQQQTSAATTNLLSITLIYALCIVSLMIKDDFGVLPLLKKPNLTSSLLISLKSSREKWPTNSIQPTKKREAKQEKEPQIRKHRRGRPSQVLRVEENDDEEENQTQNNRDTSEKEQEQQQSIEELFLKAETIAYWTITGNFVLDKEFIQNHMVSTKDISAFALSYLCTNDEAYVKRSRAFREKLRREKGGLSSIASGVSFDMQFLKQDGFDSYLPILPHSILKLVENCTFECIENQCTMAKWVDDTRDRRSLLQYLIEFLVYLQNDLTNEENDSMQSCFLSALRCLTNLTNKCAEGCDAIRVDFHSLSANGLKVLFDMLVQHAPAAIESLNSRKGDATPSLQSNESGSASPSKKSKSAMDESDDDFVMSSITAERAGNSKTSKDTQGNDQNWRFDTILLLLGILSNAIEYDDKNRDIVGKLMVDGKNQSIHQFLIDMFAKTLPDDILESLTSQIKKKGKDDIEFGWNAENMIISSYICLLIGCIMRNNRKNQQQILAALPWGENLYPFIQVLQAFLNFQKEAGVLTTDSCQIIIQIIKEMNSVSGGSKTASTSKPALSSQKPFTTESKKPISSAASPNLLPPPPAIKPTTQNKIPQNKSSMLPPPTFSQSEKKQAITQPISTARFKVNDLVDVAKRMYPGSNKPGGVGRVIQVIQGAGQSKPVYCIKYVIGGTEKNVEEKYISPASIQHRS